MSTRKDKVMVVRMTPEEFLRLKAFAESKDVSMAQILREYIKKLPKVRDG